MIPNPLHLSEHPVTINSKYMEGSAVHVVVVGGGFGGVKAALELSKRQIGRITLISNESYFLHHATLYASATGRNLAESVIPLGLIFENHPNVEIVQDTITNFDPQRKLISSDTKDFHYDKLVLSLGSVTTYFGIEGMADHAFGIKSLNELEKFRDHIHEEVVLKKLDKEFFVIGAGPTGVELASALTTYIKSLKQQYRLKNTKSSVTIVEAAPRVLPVLSESASKKIHTQLKREGIKVLVNHKVQKLDEQSITIDGKVHATSTAIWTSGVANNPFYAAHADVFQLAPNGRVIVNPYLEALKHVYVVGDNNTVLYSGRAMPAMLQAKHVAKNIARCASKQPQEKYRPRTVPTAVPVGENYSYVEWFKVYAAGRTGKQLRRLIELYGYCQLVPLKVAVPIWRAHELHDTSQF